MIWQRSGTWLCLVPPWIVPTLRIGPPVSSGCGSYASARWFNPSMTGIIFSIALIPIPFAVVCACRPMVVILR